MRNRVYTNILQGSITIAILLGTLAVLDANPALSFEASQPSQTASTPVPEKAAENLNTTAALGDNKIFLPFMHKPPTVSLNLAWVDNPDGSGKIYFLPGATARYNVSGSALQSTAIGLRWTLDGPCGVSTVFSDTINLPSGAWSHATNAPAPNCPGYHIATAQITYANETYQLDALLTVNPPSEVIAMTFPRQGFDRCYLPSVDQMQTWWTSSPYWVYNLYMGGSMFFCQDDIPNSDWVHKTASQGWSFILTWVGPQAPCSSFRIKMSSNATTAYQQGRTEAGAAFNAARMMGFAGNMVLYYDMEGYGSTASSSCRNTVDAFMRGWAERLHQLGVKAGGYGSPASSHIADWADNNPPPDDIWIAHWLLPYAYNPDATVWSSAISPSLWANHQRLRQYTGGHSETWGDISLVIDSNALDGEITTLPGLTTTTANSQLDTVQLSTTPQIQGMHWLSPQSGWVLRDGRLLSTSDNGNNWHDLTPANGQTAPILAVEFADLKEGWLARLSSQLEPSSEIEILRTQDGGMSWESSVVSLAGGVSDQPIAQAYLDFSDPQTGFLALKLQSGSSFSLGRLFATTDGGRTWEERSLPLGEPVVFLDAGHGWTAGGPAGDQLYRTLDGGRTWQLQELDLPAGLASGQVMIGLPQFDERGAGYLPVTVATGDASSLLVLRSEAQGDRWQVEQKYDLDPALTPGTALPFSLAPDGTWWAGMGEGLLVAAMDRAVPQATTPSGLPQGVLAIELGTSQDGWALVQQGNCYGEKTPMGVGSTSASQPFRCEQVMRLLATADGGQTWGEIFFPDDS